MANRLLNPFSGISNPDSGSEQIVQAKPVVLDEAVEKAYRVYEGLGFDILGNYPQISGLEKQILLPSQIDGLLQMIISKTEINTNSEITGRYLTKLIQDSYDAGNNDFMLTTGDTHISWIGYDLSGSKKKRLKIRIDGNAGIGCGEKAKFSEITIYGDARDFCGLFANYSEIVIYGNAGKNCGYLAINTKFTAHNERAYGMFKKNVSSGIGNIIRLVNSKGEVLKEEHL